MDERTVDAPGVAVRKGRTRRFDDFGPGRRRVRNLDTGNTRAVRGKRMRRGDGHGTLRTHARRLAEPPLQPIGEEEDVRWIARLFRHYCLEGRTNRLSDDYGYAYVPAHVSNGDFSKGLSGWTAAPAVAGGVEARTVKTWGSKALCIRGQSEVGDTAAVFRRSEKGASFLRTKVSGLKPGSLYSFKYAVGDVRALKQKEEPKPRSFGITNGMTMALPPERVDRLFAGMGCHSFASLGVHMRNTMLGHISLNVIAPATAAVNEESMAFVRHSVALYKDFIRPFLPTARIYPHTPERADVERLGYRALEIGAPDGSRGAMTVFAAAQSGDSAPVIRPRGIREDLFYRVTLDNSGASFEIPGYLLARDGIRISLPAPMTSELVLWEAKEAK